jgi:septation ring formation regulator EzrA
MACKNSITLKNIESRLDYIEEQLIIYSSEINDLKVMGDLNCVYIDSQFEITYQHIADIIETQDKIAEVKSNVDKACETVSGIVDTMNANRNNKNE